MQHYVRRVGLLAVAALLGACSENSMAPTGPASEQSTATYQYGGGATADLSGNDTLKFSITIDPWHATYYDLGSGNSLTFPAGSVCDPSKSSYGQGEWDRPCSSLTKPLTVTVTAWLDRWGHPRVDFSPNIRFVPSNDSRQWVKITFSDLQASLDLSFNILYCQNTHSNCKDESKTDPSLITYRDPITHKLTRRIKHFSGYNVAAGDADDSRDSYWSSLSVASPFTMVAQVSPPRAEPRGRAAITAFDRSQHGQASVNLRVPQKVSGYILASG